MLAGRWLIRWAWRSGDSELHAAGCFCLFLVFIPVLSFVPLIAASVARNIRRSRGDPSLVPLHPVGWVTVAGFWGHIPALWLASQLSGDLYTVSFSFLGPPLIVMSVWLSWRYVLKKEKGSTPRLERSQVERDGPPADEF